MLWYIYIETFQCATDDSWLENSDCLLVDCLSRPIDNRNFPVTIMNRALKSLNVSVPSCMQCNYFYANFRCMESAAVCEHFQHICSWSNKISSKLFIFTVNFNSLQLNNEHHKWFTVFFHNVRKHINANEKKYLLPLRKLDFQFLSNWMGYDRGNSLPFDFEPNRFPFLSKFKGKTVTTILSHSIWKEV